MASAWMGAACSNPSLSMAFSISADRPSCENNLVLITSAITLAQRSRQASTTPTIQHWVASSLAALLKAGAVLFSFSVSSPACRLSCGNLRPGFVAHGALLLFHASHFRPGVGVHLNVRTP